MEKPQRSQLLRTLLLLLLLTITPSIPDSFRPSYLYFLFNIFVVALGIEAGLLSAISGPLHDQQKPSNEVSLINISTKNQVVQQEVIKQVEKPAVLTAEKVLTVARIHRVKKSTSTPSLFFIGGGDVEAHQFVDYYEETEEEDEADHDSAQELFAKAEMFIGNFYKQLKMQREESWKKIHGLYHKPF
ncbi:uncharacterized protein LOC120262127 [Dioscorea cayenensis subsp. rotundata]|uniref:Uncharacterized protein LOC120262127 n=1 Tax=Dioscorea cayennensis subsp. rotundata TaxID=55577 RepID=A0AB40BI64_DIOCR|nr:uncharacterized protein LOC120262127 [Dioscorea cayenensis subsp. rotundata]